MAKASPRKSATCSKSSESGEALQPPGKLRFSVTCPVERVHHGKLPIIPFFKHDGLEVDMGNVRMGDEPEVTRFLLRV